MSRRSHAHASRPPPRHIHTPTDGLESGSSDDEEYVDDPFDFDLEDYDWEDELRHLAREDLESADWRAERAWDEDAYDVNLPQFERLRRRRDLPSSALQCFFTLLPLQTLRSIAENTIAYARRACNDEHFTTDVYEMAAFIGTVIFMGAVRYPRVRLYWDAHVGHQWVQRAFSMHRFFTVLRFFHISPPIVADDRPFARLEPLASTLGTTFLENAYAARELTVDESMVPFRGRHALKQYMPQKPIKWGFKIWSLVSDEYLLRFQIYEKSSAPNSRSQNFDDLVLQLTEPMAHRGHILYMDNLFTSLSLFDKLAERGVFACGSMRSNREGLPRISIEGAQQLQRGESWVRHRGSTGLLLRKDRRLVLLLTSHRSLIPRAHGAISSSDSLSPANALVRDYNLHKGGVDVFNQLGGYHALFRRSVRWWRCIVWWLLEATVLNAKRMYQWGGHRVLTTLDFQLALADELLDFARAHGYQSTGAQQHSSAPAAPAGHTLVRTHKDRDCVVCSHQPGHRIRSTFVCSACHVHLCAAPCFGDYHHSV